MSTKKFSNEGSFTSSDSDELLFLLSASSHDRSSVGSIPWAEDSIKRNQQEWERVERMFYGEEDLPDEPLLRNEILEWNKAFPHLRVKGHKLDNNVEESELGFSLSNTKEEILVIHPSSPLHHKDLNEVDHMKSSAQSMGPIERNHYTMSALDNYIEKDLRISSVPMVSRRAQNISKTTHNKSIINNNNNNFVHNATNIRQIIPSKSSGSLLLNGNNLLPVIKSSNSATIFRMPPILLLPAQMRMSGTELVKQASTTSGSIIRRNPIVLPPINLNRVEFNGDNTAKSARIVNQKQKQPPTSAPFSASKVHFFK